MTKYIVNLTAEQREGLEHRISTGQAPARKLIHARILLKAESGEQGPDWPDKQISEALEVSVSTIWRVRQRFVQQGLDDALNRRPQAQRRSLRKFDGEKEAHLVALTCGEKPEGEGQWSLRLLAERFVQLGYVEEVSHETVRQVLKKTSSNPGSNSAGALLPKLMPTSWPIWKMCWRSIRVPTMHAIPRCVWMK